MKGWYAEMLKNHAPRRIMKIITCVFFVLFYAAAPCFAATEKTANEPLTVGVPSDRCPVFYKNPDNDEITGIGVDLMRLAAEKAGYHATFIPITEKSLKDALDNSSYDVVMPFGSAIDSASGNESIVTENLIQTPFTLVTQGRKNLPPKNKLHVGMLKSLAAGSETVKQLFPDMEISMYDTMPECVKALRSGEVDALLHNSYVWSYVLQKPSYGDLVVQPSAMFSMDFRAGTPNNPKGQKLIARLNNGIAAISDTQRQAIILDHTTRKLYHYDFSDYLYQYGLVILLSVLLFIALCVIASQKIKYLRKKHDEQIHQMMGHDPLTGLLNTSGFRERVEELLRANPDKHYFLSYNNIRNFKFINDSFGREAGDALLKFWAKVFLENISEEYEAIGRIDTDHFVALRLITSEKNMTTEAKKIFVPVENFFIDHDKETKIHICAGIYVLTPQDFQTIDVDHIIDLARMTEKRVRINQKNAFALYNPEQWQKSKHNAEIINLLPTAIQSGDIRVWYQPQVDAETGKIVGAEALCRWHHTGGGWLSPIDFIPILEEAGLIFELDCFVWERVCQDLHRWNEKGQRRSVSVNVSRDDIREDRDIAAHFQNLLQQYDLAPDQLHIEITETAYAENADFLIKTTQRLRALGFYVEMDDFGSGYSSLHMLKEVPVDRIKMDLHFLTASGDLEKGRTIVSCMIQMIRQLGMDMIAEGVETVKQADFLRSKGCRSMQGYLFYKPMPVSDFEKVLMSEEMDASDYR